MAWTQVLDRVHSLASLDAIALEPETVAVQLATEVPSAASLAELEARDAFLQHALAHVDATIVRAMKIRLEYALAQDSSIGPPTRMVFAQTIVGYARDLGLLAQRARDIALRGRSADPDQVADAVVGAARAVLDLRAAIRSGIIDMIRQLATTTIPDADRHARDRKLSDAERRRWSAVRRDAEVLAQTPEAIVVGTMAVRVASLPEQLDEPPPEREINAADLIELD